MFNSLPHKVFPIFFVIFFASLFSSLALSTVDGAKNILFINSYHRGFSWSDDIEDSFRKGLATYKGQIELSVEYLDSRRFPGLKKMKHISQGLAQKYADYPIDLIMTSDNAAFDFITRYRDEIFPGTPVVFSGYNNFKAEVIDNFSNVTGVNEETEILGTVELATFVHPEAKTLVFIVSTRDPSSQRIYEHSLKNIFPLYEDKYDIVLLKDLSIKNISHRLNRLPENSILFISGKSNDSAGDQKFTPEEDSQLIAAASPFPAYGFWLFNMQTGVLGGKLLTGYDQGREAANMAIRILRGTAADDIPVLIKSPTTTMFDYKVMDHFNITMTRLPAESVLINQPEPIWKEYRVEIYFIIGALLVETIFIIALVGNARGRKKVFSNLSVEHNHLKNNVKSVTKELTHAKIKISELNLTDELTQLANRRHFDDTLTHEMKRARRSSGPLSLLKLKIELLKYDNNASGNNSCDRYLISLSKIFHDVIDRSSDLVARYCAEEFAIILPETDSQGANKIANDIFRLLLQQPSAENESALSKCIAINIGLMTFTHLEELSTPEELIGLTDKQLNKAKKKGQNQTSAGEK